MASETVVRARIDAATKDRLAEALESMGLSIPDPIRLLMVQIADEQRLPFAVKVPNASARAALAELDAGQGKRVADVDALMADLHADE